MAYAQFKVDFFEEYALPPKTFTIRIIQMKLLYQYSIIYYYQCYKENMNLNNFQLEILDLHMNII